MNEHLAQEGVKRWDRLMGRVEAGHWLSDDELWPTVLLYGVPPLSEAGRYVAGRLLGTIKRGRGRRRDGPTNEVLHTEYAERLHDLQQLKKHRPAEYHRRMKDRPPNEHAIRLTARAHGMTFEAVRKAIRGRPRKGA